MTAPPPSDGPPGPGLRTVALVKQVPRGDDFGTLTTQGRLRRDGLGTEMNPWCRRAVTQAVALSGLRGRSTAVTMGPPSAAAVLREAMACGVHDAVHVSDPALAGADCLATAKVLASTVRGLGAVDLVTVGRASVDGNTAVVGAMVAELLGLPFAGPVLGMTVEHGPGGAVLHTTVQAEGGGRPVSVTLPAVVAVAERSCDPAKAAADTWPAASRVSTVDLAGLGSSAAPTSPTRVTAVRDAAHKRVPLVLDGPLHEQVARALELCEEAARPAPAAAGASVAPVPPARALGPSGRDAGRHRDIVVLADGADPIGDRALLGEAAVLAAATGGRVVAVAPGAATGTGRFAAWGADEVLMLDGGAPRTVAAALADRCASHGMPWAVLGSARSTQREVLARLAVRLDAGLLSDLTGLALGARHDPAGLVGTKPSGNASVAEVVSDSAVRIATVRTGCLALRTPRDAGELPVRRLAVGPDPAVRLGDPGGAVDYDALERAEVVIGVGRGVDPGRYAELLPLRRLLGAEIAATRKVTDAGWLPHALQVGVTARDIAPRLYIALGLSGKANHMSGVGRAGTVLAVNSDATAPVFAACDIGIVADWRQFVPLLTAELERRGATAGTP
ncbi:FAD-binding protein [Streptomyces sp. NPDC020917]|uniref:FAD-binding protein n=1 Tax=Streptomyces sp. NPDC020917 TaxID=3365102 RepID=UPI0037A31BB2